MISSSANSTSAAGTKDWLTRKIDEGCTLYLQPVGLDSTGEKLAGGWQSFSSLIVYARASTSAKTFSCLVQRDAFSEIENCADTRGQFRNLVGTRHNFAGLAMDRPHIMGILNATPDSFSDGGQNLDPARAIENGVRMLNAGASVLDVGGESTRPGADPVSETEEQERVLPLIEGLAGVEGSIVSIDTRNPVTMATAVRAGAGIVNDVTALQHRVDSLRTAVKLKRPVILMHMKGQPKSMQAAPTYANVLLDVFDYLQERVEICVDKGMERSQICLDPGIGFGKTQAHCLTLLANLSLFHSLGCPLLLGVSRKSFIAKAATAPSVDNRIPGTIAATLQGVSQGAQLHRVHDVDEIVQAIDVWQKIHLTQSQL